MEATRRKNLVFAVLTGFGILTGILFLIFGESVPKEQGQIFSVCIMIGSTITAGFYLRGINKLKIARLIAENPILHIRTAVISDIFGGMTRQSVSESTEVIISYFGILMDEKIIKFNQDGIQLRDVEIGGDYISFTYGTEKRIQNIRLLRPSMELAELDKIAEKFRYETGIMPTMITL